METFEEDILLNKRLDSLGLSEDFIKTSKRMRFKTIRDVTEIEPMRLIDSKGFSYIWLGELVTFLSDRSAIHLLQPVGGKEYKKRKKIFGLF